MRFECVCVDFDLAVRDPLTVAKYLQVPAQKVVVQMEHLWKARNQQHGRDYLEKLHQCMTRYHRDPCIHLF